MLCLEALQSCGLSMFICTHIPIALTGFLPDEKVAANVRFIVVFLFHLLALLDANRVHLTD